MTQRSTIIGSVFSFGVSAAVSAAPPITASSLLSEMTDRGSIARFPSPAYVSAQSSSYDRASTGPDHAETWFANGDVNQYIRSEMHGTRKEWVMMDQDGPGAIVRVWSANPKGVLRVYIDGSETPAIETPMAEFLGGKWKAPSPLSYEASKGWNSYLPIPYAKHCTVTSDSDGFYYHVNHRTYAAGTAVESFSPAVLASAAETIRASAGVLGTERDSSKPNGLPVHQSANVKPGESLTLHLGDGSKAVSKFTVKLNSVTKPEALKLSQALRSCVVIGTFDGEPTIWCPLGDFFGTGASINAYEDWYRAVKPDGTMSAEWVMPFQKSGVISIKNFGAEPVSIEAGASVKPWTWDDRSMYFHAVWRGEYPIHAYGARGTLDFNYVDVKGKGVYVGDVLSIVNPVKEWWGEGDEKISIDGEKFPSHFGTGTEDYYGYAWGSSDTFHRPFHAQTHCDGESLQNSWGRTTLTRTRSLDAIPFTSALSMNIEVWHWKECDVEYAATSYFYAIPGASTNRTPSEVFVGKKLVEAPPLPPPYRVIGAIECENLTIAGKSPGLHTEAQGGFGPDLWSDGQQLWAQAKQPGEFVELKVPAAEGRYRLLVYATKSWDYGTVRFSVNGKAVGADLDLFSGAHDVKATGAVDLGVVEVNGGSTILRCEVVGRNTKNESNGYFFGLDCLVLEPVK